MCYAKYANRNFFLKLILFFIYVCDTRILKKIYLKFINLYNMKGFWNYARQNYYAIKLDVHLHIYSMHI